MRREVVLTETGKFSILQSNTLDNDKDTIIFFPCMGINCAEYDYDGVIDYLEHKGKYNLIAVDLLGFGYSGVPIKKERTCENISREIVSLLNKLNLQKYYLCCHSFSAIYILNCICENILPVGMKGFIGIDPTAPTIMSNYLDELHSNYLEAKATAENRLNGQTRIYPREYLNPLLSEEKKDAAVALYTDIEGNEFELSELKNAIETVEFAKELKMGPNTPTLNILSTMNYPAYQKYGNPYDTDHSKSMSLKLNGHHFLHWLFPNIIGDIIDIFCKNQ